MASATENKPLREKGKTDNRTNAQKRREEKKTALREFLSGQKYIEAINADLARDYIAPDELPTIKFKTETRLKLLNKVLPDLKAVEHTGEDGGAMKIINRIELVALGSE